MQRHEFFLSGLLLGTAWLILSIGLVTSESFGDDQSAKIDWNTPRDVLEAEAKKDNPTALLYIAMHSATGAKGFAKDDEKRAEFYRKGAAFADQGSSAAQLCRGVCLMRGYGVDENMQEAIKWVKKAAEQGLAPAQFILGECYRTVERDMEAAIKWYRKAAE